MSRPFKGGEDQLAAAREFLRSARTIEQLRQAQAVLLPMAFGLNLKQTADAIGLSAAFVSKLRNRFLAGDRIGDAPSRGGRHHELCSPEREVELLKPHIEKAQAGGVLVIGQIKPMLEEALGRSMALSTTYNLLHRHGWRKLTPDKRHPQSDPAAQVAFKKTSRRARGSSRRTP